MAITLDHIAIASRSIGDAPEFLVGSLGGTPGYGGPAGEYRFSNWDYPDGGRIEVLEPDGPPGGFLHRFLEHSGPGIHHVTFHVPDLDLICGRAQEMGHRLVQGRTFNGAYREAFLHPKTAMGIVVQLTLHSASASGSMPAREQSPGHPLPAGSPARVLGLRMRTGNRERAMAQWADLLGGRVALDQADELILRWPDSGMRVRVVIAEGAADRSEAIEVDRLPASAESFTPPRLGATFAVARPDE